LCQGSRGLLHRLMLWHMKWSSSTVDQASWCAQSPTIPEEPSKQAGKGYTFTNHTHTMTEVVHRQWGTLAHALGPYKGKAKACAALERLSPPTKLIHGVANDSHRSWWLLLGPTTRTGGVSRATQRQDLHGPLHRPAARLRTTNAQPISYSTSSWHLG
jgi:hypothetical protein